MRIVTWCVALRLSFSFLCFGVAVNQASDPEKAVYVLGIGDQIQVRVLDAEEITPGPYPIDMRGNVNLPVAGRIQASGRTPEELEGVIEERLAKYLKHPDVAVTVVQMKSQPVTVLGSVASPGVRQMEGVKSLYEILSMAGGLRQDAGYAIRITRKKRYGQIPLEGAKEDPTGQYYVAEVGAKEVMEATAPEKNIAIMPEDVISVPKGEIVYVIGAVKRPGGYVLGERDKITALQALVMAEGFDSAARGSKARILRKGGSPDQRQEIALDLGEILKNKAQDVELRNDDILFIPTNVGKRVAIRASEAAIAVGTGVAIWRSR